MDIMMRQNSLPWNSDSDYSVWNPRTLSTFQTFHGGSNGIIGNGILHSHSRSMLVEEPIEKPKPKRLASRSLGEPQEFISLNNGTLLVRDDGTMEVRIGLGPSDKRFGFSVTGGSEDEVSKPCIDKITEGSPADRADLEVGDEILEVNGKSLENATHTEVISHIHQCIRSRTICLRVKRKSGNKIATDLANNSNVQDAFVIAVEQQARERLEKLSSLKQIEPVDMAKLSQQLSTQSAPNLNLVSKGSQKSIKKPNTNGKENVSVISIGAEAQTTISISPSDELDGGLLRQPSFCESTSEKPALVSSTSCITVQTVENIDSNQHPKETLNIAVSDAESPPKSIKLNIKDKKETICDISSEELLSSIPPPKLDDINQEEEDLPSLNGSTDLDIKGCDLNLSLGNPPELLSPIGSPSAWMNEIKSKVEEETMRIPNCKSNESILKSSITPKEDEKNDGIPVRKPSRKKNEAPSQPSNTKPIGAPTTEELATQPLTLEATIYKRPPGLDDNALGVVGGKRGRGSGTLSKIIKDSILNGDENGSRGASLRSSGTSSIHSSELDDSGSHREMAVDVPDNFISRTKTPPKWPTMKPTVNGYKPVLPSRDHLRIEEDGRLINRAQPPSWLH